MTKVDELAQILHDLAHPDDTHLAAGSLYRAMAERIAEELKQDGALLYEWLADRAKARR